MPQQDPKDAMLERYRSRNSLTLDAAGLDMFTQVYDSTIGDYLGCIKETRKGTDLWRVDRFRAWAFDCTDRWSDDTLRRASRSPTADDVFQAARHVVWSTFTEYCDNELEACERPAPGGDGPADKAATATLSHQPVFRSGCTKFRLRHPRPSEQESVAGD